jgi:superfamily I DNA and/or RNA helicase
MDQVECRTVHRFQGNERDLVILDMVDSAPYPPGVLMATGASAPHLLNVSVSRARAKLIVISDLFYFETTAADTPAQQLLEEMRDRGALYLAASVFQQI